MPVSGFPLRPCKNSYLEKIINPSFARYVRSRWLDVSLVLIFCLFIGLNFTKSYLPMFSSHVDVTFGQ